ncbi:MAG: type II toxin-antitoxin system VapC family toxin [Dehalococcoidia bacterium]
MAPEVETIFIDTNVPIYAAGRPHPLKQPCIEVLQWASVQPMAFVTDAEVLQELLHRYLSLRLWPQGKDVLEWFADLMEGRIEPVHAADVRQAAQLAGGLRQLSGRDLLHAAVMQRVGVNRMVSADAGFDGLPGVERLDPALVAEWAPGANE